MKKQRGMTFIGLVLIIAAGLFIGIIAMKLAPAYLEYFNVKNAVTKIGNEASFADMTKKDIADEFDRSATIDSIEVVQGRDLEVTKDESGKQIVSIDYQKVIPIVANISVLVDFSASTGKSHLVTPSQSTQ
jgi:Tfp pilus assembly protein PilE